MKVVVKRPFKWNVYKSGPKVVPKWAQSGPSSNVSLQEEGERGGPGNDKFYYSQEICVWSGRKASLQMKCV
jgi:hypothetical protein